MEYFGWSALVIFVMIVLFPRKFGYLLGKVYYGIFGTDSKRDPVDTYLQQQKEKTSQQQADEIDDFNRRHSDILDKPYTHINKTSTDVPSHTWQSSLKKPAKIQEIHNEKQQIQHPVSDLIYPRNSIGNYHITYESSDGSTSKRSISIISENGYYLYAYCHMRHAKRTFIIHNIKEAVNLETGEVVGNIVDDMYENYKKTPAGRYESIINTEIHAVRILLFIAKGDGRMVKAERALIVDFLKKNDDTINELTLDSLIKEMLPPGALEFKETVADMAKKDKEKLQELYQYAQRIVATGKTIDPMEESALKIMQNALT